MQQICFTWCKGHAVTCCELACHGNRYIKLRMQQICVSRRNKHAGTTGMSQKPLQHLQIVNKKCGNPLQTCMPWERIPHITDTADSHFTMHETRDQLACHTYQYCMQRSRAKTLEPTTNSCPTYPHHRSRGSCNSRRILRDVQREQRVSDVSQFLSQIFNQKKCSAFPLS